MWKMESEKVYLSKKSANPVLCQQVAALSVSWLFPVGATASSPDKRLWPASVSYRTPEKSGKAFPQGVRLTEGNFMSPKRWIRILRHQWPYSKEPRCWALCLLEQVIRRSPRTEVLGLASSSLLWQPWEWNISSFFLKTISYKSRLIVISGKYEGTNGGYV